MKIRRTRNQEATQSLQKTWLNESSNQNVDLHSGYFLEHWSLDYVRSTLIRVQILKADTFISMV